MAVHLVTPIDTASTVSGKYLSYLGILYVLAKVNTLSFAHSVMFNEILCLGDSTTLAPPGDKKRSRPPEEHDGREQIKRSRLVPHSHSSSCGVHGEKGILLQRSKMHRSLTTTSSSSSSEHFSQVHISSMVAAILCGSCTGYIARLRVPLFYNIVYNYIYLCLVYTACQVPDNGEAALPNTSARNSKVYQEGTTEDTTSGTATQQPRVLSCLLLVTAS